MTTCVHSRTAAGLVGLAITMLGITTGAYATPFGLKDNKGVWHWKRDTIITVYVPLDGGADTDRRKALVAGIEAWNKEQTLKDQNINIQTTSTQPAAGTSNVVTTSWADPSRYSGNEKGGAYPSVDPDAKGNTIVSGKIEISNAITKDGAGAIGTHEMGHILGLKDSTKPGEIMYGDNVPSTGISDGDRGELKAAYTASADLTQTDVKVVVTPVGVGYRYSYTTTWLAGGNLAVFQVDTSGAAIFDLSVPYGWKVDDFSYGPSVSPVLLGTRNEQFVGFIHEADALGNVIYLDADHPSFTFAFTSAGAPGSVEAYLNGRFPTVGPVPEPTTLTLIATGLLVRIRRQRRPSARTSR